MSIIKKRGKKSPSNCPTHLRAHDSSLFIFTFYLLYLLGMGELPWLTSKQRSESNSQESVLLFHVVCVYPENQTWVHF